MRRRKEARIVTISKKLFVFSVIVFILSTVLLNSYEIRLNANKKKLNEEIKVIQSDIDSLEMKKQKLVAFSRVKKIAANKGYTYKQGSVAAVVEGDSDE